MDLQLNGPSEMDYSLTRTKVADLQLIESGTVEVKIIKKPPCAPRSVTFAKLCAWQSLG